MFDSRLRGVYFYNMKWRIPFAALKPVLPADLTEELKSFIEDDEDAVVCRKAAVDKSKSLDPGEREVLQYVSTRDIDRDSEILDPSGAVLSEFKKAPQVLWGHNYAIPPIGSDRKIESDGYGLLAVTRYAKTALGEEVWSLRRDGHLNTSSVGFIPLKSVANGEEGWSKLVAKLAGNWGVEPAAFEKARNVITKWLLLEHSDVSVPANINARTVSLGTDKAAELIAEGKRLQDLITKGAIHTPEIREALEKRAESLIALEPGITPEDEPASIDESPEVRAARRIIIEHQTERCISIVEDEDLKGSARRCIMQIRGQLT